MQAEQRVDKKAEAFEPIEEYWIPYTVHGLQGGRRDRVKVESGDRYAAVDDVADGMVIFSVSDWPRLDREGRLYWETDPSELVAAADDTQAIVDDARREAGITAPDRAIRVGDAFLIRDLPRNATTLAQASLVLDISAAARDAAKAALYGAAASTLHTDYAANMALAEGYEEPEPDAGYFDVRQIKLGSTDGRETAE
ncbi:MAG: hypothetical protein ACRDVL_05025 [Acidimicrobiia bacterium]